MEKTIFDIIPTWFSSDVDESMVTQLLSNTLAYADLITSNNHHYLYLDGIENFSKSIQAMVDRLCPKAQIELGKENKGKGAGVFHGLSHGLQSTNCQWFLIRDADGDHRAVDYPLMLELGTQIQKEWPDEDKPILIIGGRNRLEPPLSLYRAAYENILNPMIQSCLHFALARRNYIQDCTYFRQYHPIPDIQSGYKLYNRKAAELVVDQFQNDKEDTEFLFRWGAEIAPYVWIVLNGGIIGETRRSTCREQPVTAYGSIKRAECYARKIAWVFQNCDINLWNAARIIDNELTWEPLIFDAMGKMEFSAFRKTVLSSLKKRDADQIPPLRGGTDFL